MGNFKKILSCLYNHHNKETMVILGEINSEVELYKKYDMYCSNNHLKNELSSIQNLDEKIDFLINAGYIEEQERSEKYYRLTKEGKKILRKYSKFNTLNKWGIFIYIARDNSAVISLISIIISIIAIFHSRR